MALSVRGYFSERRRQPYVVAFRAALPRLGVSTDIRFLVDTGADSTVIHWGDRARLRTADGERLPIAEEFSGRTRMTGIAGSAVEYGEEPPPCSSAPTGPIWSRRMLPRASR